MAINGLAVFRGQTLGLVLAAILITALPGCKNLNLHPDSSPISVTEIGRLRVGKPLPSYSGGSFGPTSPAGRFFIHFSSNSYPLPLCSDEECGPLGVVVRDRGGHLVAGSDWKFADAILGVLPPHVEGKAWDEYEWGVAVVSNDQGKILAIYDNVTAENLDVVVEAFANY